MHPLDGPRLKVGRAESEIESLRRAEEAFRRESKYEIVRRNENPKTGNCVYRVRTHGSNPPQELAVDIGEIAHNLRSALEHLVHQLVLLAGNAPTWGTGFPISLTKSGTRRKPVFDIQRLDRLKGVLAKHQAMIEGLQPYKRGRGGKADALWRLHEINRFDKHRLLPVVAAKRGGLALSFWESEAAVEDISIRKLVMLKDGAKIGEAPAGVHVNPKLMPLIAFGRGSPEVVVGVGVLSVLTKALDRVSEIVETFAPDFRP